MQERSVLSVKPSAYMTVSPVYIRHFYVGKIFDGHWTQNNIFAFRLKV